MFEQTYTFSSFESYVRILTYYIYLSKRILCHM